MESIRYTCDAESVVAEPPSPKVHRNSSIMDVPEPMKVEVCVIHAGMTVAAAMGDAGSEMDDGPAEAEAQE